MTNTFSDLRRDISRLEEMHAKFSDMHKAMEYFEGMMPAEYGEVVSSQLVEFEHDFRFCIDQFLVKWCNTITDRADLIWRTVNAFVQMLNVDQDFAARSMSFNTCHNICDDQIIESALAAGYRKVEWGIWEHECSWGYELMKIDDLYENFGDQIA
jgi:hypothetical protein